MEFSSWECIRDRWQGIHRLHPSNPVPHNDSQEEAPKNHQFMTWLNKKTIMKFTSVSKSHFDMIATPRYKMVVQPLILKCTATQSMPWIHCNVINQIISNRWPAKFFHQQKIPIIQANCTYMMNWEKHWQLKCIRPIIYR